MTIFPVTTLAMKCRTSQILDCANSFPSSNSSSSNGTGASSGLLVDSTLYIPFLHFKKCISSPYGIWGCQRDLI